MNIVSMMPKLKEELRTIFNDYGLKYVFDTNSQEIKVMKEKKPGEIFLIPFHSIADTLQRMIFYKAAIESNSESALVFEEPEAHSYPPFISKVTQDIIQSDRNQFFITTLFQQRFKIKRHVFFSSGKTFLKPTESRQLFAFNHIFAIG